MRSWVPYGPVKISLIMLPLEARKVNCNLERQNSLRAVEGICRTSQSMESRLQPVEAIDSTSPQDCPKLGEFRESRRLKPGLHTGHLIAKTSPALPASCANL